MKLLIVVDMQKDFIDGSLGSAEAVAIVPNVRAKIDEYRKNGDIIAFTMDTHHKDYLETMEGKYLPVEHCIINTPGWEIYPDLANEDDICVLKARFGVSNMIHTIEQIREKFVNNPNNNCADAPVNIDSIELVGLCTDICVVSNALILKSLYDIPVIVDASCCAGVTPDKHKAALEVMKSCQCEVINM